MRRRTRYLLAALLGLALGTAAAARSEEPRHILLIAGAKSHPVGMHEYLRTVKLLKYLLEHSAAAPNLIVDTYFNGWPDDPAALERADTIVSMGDSGDYPVAQRPVSFLTDERMPVMAKAMQRGAGLVTLHSATFAPSAFAQQILQWTGGYFDWQGGHGEGGFYGSPVDDHTRSWHSFIRTEKATVALPSPAHPVSQGVTPFTILDEFYYQLRFVNGADGWQPILAVPAFAAAPGDQVVAWALQRAGNGGRGFGFTAGHYYANWRQGEFRKLVLNGILWSAGLPVPAHGVESTFASEDEVNHAELVRPIRTLIVGGGKTGVQFDSALAPGVASALNSETPRFEITTTSSTAPLATDLSGYRLVVLTDCSVLRSTKQNLAGLSRYLQRGGGLLIVYSTAGANGVDASKSSPGSLANLCKPLRWGRTVDTANTGGNDWARKVIDMKIVDAAHPAVRGLEDRLVEKWESSSPIEFDIATDVSMHAVATGRSVDSGRESPMAFVMPFGKGRIIQVVAGDMHQIDVAGKAQPPLQISNLSPVTVNLMRQGALWAANDDLTAPAVSSTF